MTRRARTPLRGGCRGAAGAAALENNRRTFGFRQIGGTMMQLSTRSFSRTAHRAAAACVLGLAAWACQAAPALLPATPTVIEGSAERMISYRHQDHMWQTSDGATHAIVNVGNQPSGASLRMYSSPDSGSTWEPGLALAQSSQTSTADGFIADDRLFVSYQSSSGTVEFVRLDYDATTRTWAQTAAEQVFASADVVAFNPSVARDAQGRFWLAFTSLERASGNYGIRLMRRSSAAEGWVDTGLTFGAIDNLSIERSARPIATRYGVGMVYTVHEDTYWAWRRNDLPVGAAWAEQLVYTRQSPETDPFASHFSVVGDAQDNLHMALVDNGSLLYFRQPAGSGQWNFITATAPANTVYAQILVADASLVMIANHNTLLRVFQSPDSGNSWANTHLLTHPLPSTGISYARPRVEAPARTQGPIPVLQQYVDNGVQRAMSFQVPALAPAPR